jgi:hypothetical protein
MLPNATVAATIIVPEISFFFSNQYASCKYTEICQSVQIHVCSEVVCPF